MVVITSRQVKNLRSRYGASGAKDDRFDAFVLADTLRTDRARLRPLVPDAAATIALRAAVRARRDLVAHRVAACNQLRAHLAAAFPAAIGLSCELDSPISLAFLARFGCHDAAAQLSEQQLARWLEDAGRRRGNTAPAGVLCARLQAAAPGVTGADGTAQADVTAALAAALSALAAQVKILETRIAAQLAAHPDAHIFTSLPRAGTLRAARLLAEIGDCRSRFPDPESLAGLAGIAPVTRQSGKHASTGIPVGGQPPAPRRLLRLRRRFPACQRVGSGYLRGRARPRQRPPARRAHPGPRLELHHLALLAGRHRLRPRQAHRPAAHPGPASHPARSPRPAAGTRAVSAALTGALRTRAAGLYPDEAGTELLIRHGGILHREDFAGFVHTGTSISDGTTQLAWIDWDAALSALHHGRLPLSSGEQHILTLAASIAAGALTSLRDALPGLDNRNLELLVTAVRHAAGHPSRHH